MRDIIEPPPDRETPRSPLWKRVAWFAGLSLTAGLSTAVIAYVLKVLLH